MNKQAVDLDGLFEPLLDYIQEGRVIPVVGRELLTLDGAGGHQNLHDLLAERLARHLNLADDPGEPNTLNSVAGRYLVQNNRIDAIYRGINRVITTTGDLPIPTPLLQLAEIRPLRLFISTTFDNLLERALRQVRGRAPAVYSYSLQSPNDLPANALKGDQDVVFHLMGRVSALTDEYAVTDEDLLEVMHSLYAHGPAVLQDELRKGHLLIVGTGFPDWLLRFFIRIAKGNRLFNTRRQSDTLADRLTKHQVTQAREAPAPASPRRRVEDRDLTLASFLKYFSADTSMFPLEGAEFVAALLERWHARQPAALPAAAGERAEKLAKVGEGAIFISYAHEDGELVARISEELKNAQLEVWFDDTSLEPGDPIWNKIYRAIDRSSAFVPILSRTALDPGPRSFRREWVHAAEVASHLPANAAFIVPVVIDDTPPDEDALPDRFRAAHSAHWPKDADWLIERLKAMYRSKQKTIARTQ